MMELNLSMFLIVCPLVFLSQFIDAIAGGGGLISLPAYYLAGLSPVLAAGTNKLSAVIGTGVSAVQYAKKKCIDWNVVLYSAIGAIPGSIIGARLLQVVPENTARIVMICILPVIAFFVLRNKESLKPTCLVPPKAMIPACFLIGLGIGVYDGLIGPGTGTFLILCFLKILGMDGMKPLGCARCVNFASNIGAVTTLFVSGNVLYSLGLAAAVFSVLGNLLGVRCAMKGGMKLIRKLLIVVLCLIFVKLAYDVFTSVIAG